MLLAAPLALVVAAGSLLTAAPATAAPVSVHEITAVWAGDPAPAEAPFGQPVTAEWRVNTNDADDPYSNEPVDNVRATLTAGNGVFTSIPSVCKTRDVAPVSEISGDGATLLCNVGTVREGTATVIQTPLRASSTTGGNLTVSGTATSDSAAAEAGPADPGALPIAFTYGMDLSLVSAPGQAYQGGIEPSRTGGTRTFVSMNYSLILAAGSRPGPATYSFPVGVTSNVTGALSGLQWEGCVPVGISSQATGQPYSDPAQADRTNFPTCSVSGSGTSYTVSLSDLDYTLVNTPTRDSLGQPLPGNGAYIASGTVRFSIPAPVTQVTNFRFIAAPGAFTFADGTTRADGDATNNASTTTLVPPGNFSNSWYGAPTSSRSHWDTNLWVSPATSADIELPQPGIDDIDDYNAAIADGTISVLPLYMQASSGMWSGYQGAGGAQLAGVCTMTQNTAFVPTWVDGGGWDPGTAYRHYTTARFFYTTAAIDTKTETCGEAGPSAKWVEVVPPAGHQLTDPRIGNDILMPLPAGVTAVKMTWDPAVDRPRTAQGTAFVRVLGHIDENAPTSGEGWTVGTFNSPLNPATTWPGYPTLNNWVNIGNAPGGANLPGSTYGPNLNGYRDAFRLQGPQGLLEKVVSDTTALPGVPVTYTLRAQAQNLVTSPPPVSFEVVDTLPEGMVYVAGSGRPAPSSVSADGRTLTWSFTNVEANVFQDIRYQAQRPADSVIAPGTNLTNIAVINVPGDNRPSNTFGRTATATVTVPSASATQFGKSAEDNVLAFEGDTSAWVLTINSQDPVASDFTDTIDILPAVGDGRGTNIDGTYTVTGVTAPAGSTVYYTTAPLAEVSSDPRDLSNGGTPGSVAGNTVGWSTTAVDNPTAIRVLGPALAPGATQTIRIAYETPAGSSCTDPAADDNKPGQILVNSAGSWAEHSALPMLSSATTEIGSCYAANLKKFVQDRDGNWHDANTLAEYPTFKVGDTINYRVVVTNIGQGTLTNVVISDDLQPEHGSFTVEALAPGASETHEYSIVADASIGDGVVNTVCGSADAPPAPELPATIVCDPAGIRVDGDPTHVKSLLSATPIGGGQWELVYGIDVSNTSTASTSYSLADTLHFTEHATITSATVTAAPDGVTLADPAWDGQTNTQIASLVPLVGSDDAGYAPHHYEVTVVADVPLQIPGAGSADDPTECGPDGDDTDRAFNNTSALTKVDGEVEEDQACAPIPSIDIAKSVSAGPTPNGDGTWTVTYDITATNTGAADGIYEVTDRMTADGDMTVVSGAVTTTPDGVTASPAWTGLGAESAPENVIASGVNLPPGGTHTYQVEVVIGIDPAVEGAPVIADCSADPAGQGGLSNSAGVEQNDLTDEAVACVTIAFITIDKTISAGPTPNGDGTYTITYDLDVENVGAAAGDYDLRDQLRYGEGIDIVSAEVVTTPAGVTADDSWTGEGAALTDAENLIAEGITLAVAGQHRYQVEVVVELDEATIDPAALGCPAPGSGADGGLANSASVTHNGIVGTDEECASLPLLRIVKTISDGPTENGDGTWTITYELDVTNDGQAAGEYDLTDDLQYGEGIVVESAAVTAAPDGIEPNAGWTGQGKNGSDENLVVGGVALDAAGVHTYQVQVVVSLDQAKVTPDTLACPPPGSGERGGLANTAELTHNGESQSDDECAPLPLIDIVKSIAGAVVPVDGAPGEYDVSYELTVTNSGPGAGAYNLDDQLQPGDGVQIVGVQSVSTDAPDPVGLNAGFDGVGDVRIVTGQPIVGAVGAPVVHTYTVVVRYAADLAGIDLPTGDQCTDGSGGPVPGALNNTATVGWNGIDESDDECIRPGKPTLDKQLVSASPVGDGQWEVVYDLTVGNVGHEATVYDLDDEFLFAPAVTVDAVTVTGPDGVEINPDFDGDADQRIATGVTIIGLDDAGYAPHVYTVTATVNVPLAFPAPAEDGAGAPGCTVPAGGNLLEQGLNNAATLTDENGGEQTDTDCAPLPAFDIDKAITGQPSVHDGQVSTTYDIVVTNTGATHGGYVLRDQLRYGAGLTVKTVTAANTVPGDIPVLAGYTGQGDDLTDAANQVTDLVDLAAGASHTYRVIVTATITDAATGATGTCTDDGSAGGVRNVAAIDHNGLTADDAVCASFEIPGKPAGPDLASTGVAITGALGGAAVLLLLGAAILIARRRRQTTA